MARVQTHHPPPKMEYEVRRLQRENLVWMDPIYVTNHLTIVNMNYKFPNRVQKFKFETPYFYCPYGIAAPNDSAGSRQFSVTLQLNQTDKTNTNFGRYLSSVESALQDFSTGCLKDILKQVLEHRKELHIDDGSEVIETTPDHYEFKSFLKDDKNGYGKVFSLKLPLDLHAPQEKPRARLFSAVGVRQDILGTKLAACKVRAKALISGVYIIHPKKNEEKGLIGLILNALDLQYQEPLKRLRDPDACPFETEANADISDGDSGQVSKKTKTSAHH